jgi:hypothetical protein
VCGFGFEELGAEVADLVVGVAALTRLTDLEFRVGWEQTLVVGRAFRSFFPASRVEGWPILVSKSSSGIAKCQEVCTCEL